MTFRRHLLLHVFSALLLSSTAVAGQALKSGRYEVAVPIPTPPCSATRVLCVADSTRTVTLGECCMDYSTALWIVLPAREDSLEFVALSAGADHPLVTLSKPGRSGASWQEHLPGLTAPFVRHRFEVAAPYVLEVLLSPMSPKLGDRYELRIRTVAGKPLAAAPGTITLIGDTKAWFSLRRLVGGKSVPDSAGAALLRPGTYRLLATSTDTLRICKEPCTSPQTIRADVRTAVVVR